MSDTTRSLKVESLDLIEAPGFTREGIIVDEFSDGINVIYGPNAAGKTTMAESIEALLWPEEVGDQFRLTSHFSLGEEEWRAQVDFRSSSYQRNGTDANRPNLPAAHNRDRYRLPLHELLESDTTNEHFAETVARQSAGGIDLKAVENKLGYGGSPSTRRISEYQEAAKARESYQEATRAANALEEERSELPELKVELEEAKQARERHALLDDVLDYFKHRSTLQERDQRLNQFPEILEDVDGDEVAEVESITEEIDEWWDKRETARDQKDDANETLAEVDLGENDVDDAKIERLKEQRDNLKSLEDEQERLSRAVSGKQKEREKIRRDIPLEVETDDLVELEPVTWKEISEFSRSAQAVEARRESVKALETWASPSDDELVGTDVETLRRASRSLEQWLRSAQPEPEGDARRTTLIIGSLSFIGFVAVGVILAILNSLEWILFGLPGLGLFGYAVYHWFSSESSDNQRSTYRGEFEELEVDPPDEWSAETVRQRLLDLYDAIAEHKKVEKRLEYRDAKVEDVELEEAESELEERRNELQKTIGAAPDTSDVELTVLIKRILDWQNVHEELIELEGQLEEIDRQISENRTEIQNELASFGYDSITDSSNATEAIRDLESREQRRRQATSNLESAESIIEEADEKIQQLEDDREEIYLGLDLEVGDKESLRELCEQVESYEKVKENRDEAKAVLDAKRDELSEMEGFEEGLLEADRGDLVVERDEAESLADRYDDLHEEITQIETNIDRAKGERTVQEALTEKERAMDKLENQLEADISELVGGVLVEHLREKSIEADRPEVYDRAQDIFTNITHGNYRLEFDDHDGEFRAFDTTRQVGLSLDELSSGTRVQLLLAVRLGFVEMQESETKLPLILDETLANSDDQRGKVIIDSLIELADNGRQIFYFTAQGHEVTKWLDAVDGGEIDYRLIDMSEIRDFSRGVSIPDSEDLTVVSPDPPDPSDHDLETYVREINVPPFNPYEAVGNVHLWYLVDDLEELYTALSCGIERWGQLSHLSENGDISAIGLDTENLEQIRCRANALEVFLECWQIGRGTPIDRTVLEDSGAVSDTFIEEVTELARACNGDPQGVIEGLRDRKVDNFRSGKIDELEEYLRDHGHIDPTEPLDQQEIRARMIARLTELGLNADRANETVDGLLQKINQTR